MDKNKKKLTPEQQLYIDLGLYFTGELNDKTDEQVQEFHVQQKENRDRILNELAKIMLSYSIIDSVMDICDSDKFKLQSRLNTLVQNKIQSEVNRETLKTKDLLKYVGKNKYNSNSYINSVGNVKSNLLSEKDKTLDNIINTKIDKKTWSDRLWDNKNDLQKDLKAEIKDFLDGKTSVNDIEKRIKSKYNTNAYETKRLVQDNVARVQEGMNEKWRIDHGVKWVLYMATLCHSTCDDCRQYDGKSYEVGREPIELPQHPFCRCTYANIPSKDWRPSERLDNETKEKVNWQTYEEWYKNNPIMTRKKSNTGAFKDLEEPMQLKHVKQICRELEIDLSGIKIKIQRDKNLINLPYMGSADPKEIGRIDLFPGAFKNRDELLRTIVHEKVHVEQYKKYGGKYVMENRNKFEKEAETLEEIWYNNYKKRR